MALNRTLASVGVVVALMVLVVVWYLFRPELLFVNTTVNEAAPAAVVAAPTAAPAAVVAAPTAAPTAMAATPTAAPAAVAAEATMQPATPEAMAKATAAPTAMAAQKTVWTAHFRSLAHETTGTAAIHTLEDGSRLLRLEDFRTSNGPDVRVYLVRSTDGTQDSVINKGDIIDLGALKGNIGNQNYAIPADIDLSQYQAVSIWCRRFSVNFGGTSLDNGE